jgi:segregation and condensation protein A
MTFEIKTKNFSGPLELLLDLIEKRKLYIGDVAIASVADDFVEYINSRSDMEIDEIADFVFIASTLLLIKSKSLLPTLDLSTEEKGDIRNLETRLKMLDLIRKTSIEIERLFGKNILFLPSKSQTKMRVFAPLRDFDISIASTLMMSLIDKIPYSKPLPKVAVKKIISLEDMIGRLANRITKELKMSFKDFSKGDKVHVIVSFLAMLELVKRGAVEVKQHGNFNDIEIETKDVGVPTY